MSFKTLLLPLLTGHMLLACFDSTRKEVSQDDLAAVRLRLEKADTLPPGKKKYIIDNISRLAEKKSQHGNLKGNDHATFKEKIVALSDEYDVFHSQILEKMATNKSLQELLTLKEVEVYGKSADDARLVLIFECKNLFGKDILKATLDYKFVDEYNIVYFDNKMEIAGLKPGELRIETKEHHNDVARFVFSKVPTKSYVDGRGDHDRDFMMNGLHADIVNVVFSDNSVLTPEPVKWVYFNPEDSIENESYRYKKHIKIRRKLLSILLP